MKIVKANKKLILPTILIVLMLGGILLVLEKTRVTDFIKDPTYKESSTQGPTPQQQEEATKAAASQKEAFIESGAKEQEQAQPAEAPQDSSSITLTASQANDTVTVLNKLSGQGYSSGSCKLNITNQSKTTSQTADIIYQPEYSMCAGFSVPVSTLGAGDWNITLEVTPFNASTLTKKTSLKVQ